MWCDCDGDAPPPRRPRPCPASIHGGGGGRELTADEARATAAAEGLELVPSAKSKTGFKGVSKNGGKYKVEIKENGKLRFLGNFATPEEAALCYARNVNTL